MKARFGTVYIDNWGYKPAMVFEGRSRLSAVIQTPSLVVVHLPLDAKIKELKTWTPRRAAIRLRQQGRKYGQTKEAVRLLRNVE